jgi:hypothetical protein
VVFEFFEKAFVSQVKRRMPIRIARFWRFTKLVSTSRVRFAFDAALSCSCANGGALTVLALRLGMCIQLCDGDTDVRH